MDTQQTQVQTTESVQTETPADTVLLSGEGEGEVNQASTVAEPVASVETAIVPFVDVAVLFSNIAPL